MRQKFLRRSCQRPNSARSQYVHDRVDSSRRRDNRSDSRSKCHPVSRKQSHSHRQTGTPIDDASNNTPPVLSRRTRSRKDPLLRVGGPQGTNVLCTSRLDRRPTSHQRHSLRSRTMRQCDRKGHFDHPDGRSHCCRRPAARFLASRFPNRSTEFDLCDEIPVRCRTLVAPNMGEDAAVGWPFIYRTSGTRWGHTVPRSSGRGSVGAGRLFQRVGSGVARPGRRIGSSRCSHFKTLDDGSLARHGCPRSSEAAPNGQELRFGHPNVSPGIAFRLSLNHLDNHSLLSRCAPFRVRHHPVGPLLSNDRRRRSCSVSRSRRATPGSCKANVANHSLLCSSKSNGQSA